MKWLKQLDMSVARNVTAMGVIAGAIILQYIAMVAFIVLVAVTIHSLLLLTL